MKFAVVIGVGTSPDALAQATKTQGVLLDHLGDKLASIRLTVPRLLRLACSGALAERPDVLVVAGGPRTARAAGQIAHQHGIPILFLPGLRSPDWVKRLSGSRSLDDMVDAMAREDIRATRIGVGLAGTEMFFGEAQSGVLPQLAYVHQAFKEAETFGESWSVLGRAAGLARLAGSALEIEQAHRSAIRTSALVVTAQNNRKPSADHSVPGSQTFNCASWSYPAPLDYALAILRAARSGDWRDAAQADRFDCDSLTLNTHAGGWLLLDGEPIPCAGTTVLKFIPNAVRVCACRKEPPVANDNATPHFARVAKQSSKGLRNNQVASHVLISSTRNVRDHTKG